MKTDTIGMLEAAARAASLRQSTIANNIANLDTPGFKRSDVQFQDVLASALKDGRSDPSKLSAAVLQTNNTPVNSIGNDVDIDTEVGLMVENDTAYKTYMRLIAKLYRQMDMAIRGE